MFRLGPDFSGLLGLYDYAKYKNFNQHVYVKQNAEKYIPTPNPIADANKVKGSPISSISIPKASSCPLDFAKMLIIVKIKIIARGNKRSISFLDFFISYLRLFEITIN
jgi:hypothetical protein